jgi:hypothetical protein
MTMFKYRAVRKSGSTGQPTRLIVQETGNHRHAVGWNHDLKAWEPQPEVVAELLTDDELETIFVDRAAAEQIALRLDTPLPSEETLTRMVRERVAAMRVWYRAILDEDNATGPPTGLIVQEQTDRIRAVTWNHRTRMWKYEPQIAADIIMGDWEKTFVDRVEAEQIAATFGATLPSEEELTRMIREGEQAREAGIRG